MFFLNCTCAGRKPESSKGSKKHSPPIEFGSPTTQKKTTAKTTSFALFYASTKNSSADYEKRIKELEEILTNFNNKLTHFKRSASADTQTLITFIKQQKHSEFFDNINIINDCITWNTLPELKEYQKAIQNIKDELESNKESLKQLTAKQE